MSIVGKMEICNSTFHWRIENFSSINTATGTLVRSPAFETSHSCAKKLKWQLAFYPGGVTQLSKDYMSLFLYYLSEGQVLASYSFSIINNLHQRVFEFAPEKASVFKQLENWGTQMCFFKRIVRDETTRALSNDTLTISCTISVKSTALDNRCCEANESVTAHFEKLLESGVLSDITFEIENKQMRLHRAIITSLSPVFLAMFQHQMEENESSVVKITDVKYDIMKELFRYIYVRKVNDIESIACDLLVAADKYDVKALKLMCENALSVSINTSNALQCLIFAVKYSTTFLKSKAVEFIVKRLEEFVNKPEFVQMDAMCKDELLRAMARNKVKSVS